MPYTVKAVRPVKESHACHDLKAAVSKSIELTNDGCSDVAILDPNGQDVTDTGEGDDFNEKN